MSGEMNWQEALGVRQLFGSPEHTLAWDYLCRFAFPWQALSGLAEEIRKLGNALPASQYRRLEGDVWVADTAVISSGALILGPTIIGPRTEVRHGAYIRGGALVGADAVVGNSVELKNCILFDGVQVPHFNYVGDSVLGYRAHLGAGAVTSNVKSDKTPVSVLFGVERVDTGCRKLGAMLGDLVEVGCNSVLNPGTVIGRGSRVYPLSSVRGYLPPDCIYKADGQVVPQR